MGTVILLLSLTACGGDKKGEFYEQFVSLVENGEYEKAVDFWYSDYGNYFSGSYQEFETEFLAYKDLSDYLNYAKALKAYQNDTCQSLDDTLYRLEGVAPDFLDTAKYLDEITAILNPLNGVYENPEKDGDIYRYIIINDGTVWFAHGFAMDDLGFTYFDEKHELKFISGLSPLEYCEKEAEYWSLYMIDGQYMLGNSLVKSADDCVFVLNGQSFELGSMIEAAATDNRLEMFSGTYEKVSNDFTSYQ